MDPGKEKMEIFTITFAIEKVKGQLTQASKVDAMVTFPKFRTGRRVDETTEAAVVML